MSYNTKQKELILNVIKNHHHSFTIKDIYEKVDGVGLTTIYRYIDKLVSDGVVNKSIGLDNTTYYEYLEECDCHNHFYLKCDNCGEITHVDCDCIEDLSNHIINKHKFNINNHNIVINGICCKCRK